MANYSAPVNPFAKGNRHYKKIKYIGRPRKYATPDALWQAACTYFTWCQDSPIPGLAFRRGKLVTLYKVREMSVKQLCITLDICNLDYYKTLNEFKSTVTRIKYVIHEYNYIHAAAGVLKGRSVGHTIRKKTKKHPVDKRKVRIITQIISPAPLERDGERSHTTPIKNAIAPLRDTLKKTRIDARKVRIITQIISPAPLERAGVRPHATPIRNAIAHLRKYPVDTRKVRISAATRLYYLQSRRRQAPQYKYYVVSSSQSLINDKSPPCIRMGI